MTEISFYHLERSPLETVLPNLLEKTLVAGKRALVVAGSVERVEAFDGLLWTYHQEAWLPHGTEKDDNPADHPVWLSVTDDNVNAANFLFLTDGATSERVAEYERCFELFDGNDSHMISAARLRWNTYQDAGYVLTYWQQNEDGGWNKKD